MIAHPLWLCADVNCEYASWHCGYHHSYVGFDTQVTLVRVDSSNVTAFQVILSQCNPAEFLSYIFQHPAITIPAYSLILHQVVVLLSCLLSKTEIVAFTITSDTLLISYLFHQYLRISILTIISTNQSFRTLFSGVSSARSSDTDMAV